MNSQSPGWTIAVARDRRGADITPYTVRIRDAIPLGIEMQNFPYLLEVTWVYFSTRAGHPEEIDEDRMDEFEDLIEDGLSTLNEAALMATITGKGQRVWFWYVRDINKAEHLINQALADKDPFPIELNMLMDAKWEQYFKIRKSAMENS